MAAPSEEGQQTGLNKNKKYYIHIKGDKAVILYPSLVTPSLVESGDYGAAGGCLTVILATDEGFYTGIHCKDPGRKDAAIGSLTARKLHSQLALAPWGEKAIFDTGALEYSNQKWQLISPLHMIYLSHTGAVEAYGNKYRGWYLGELKGEKRPVQGYDADGKPRPWGVIHEGAAKMYASKGYKYLFQLNFKGLNRAPGMYELAFVYYELPDDNELSKIAEVADDLQKVVKDENDNEISRKSFDEEEKDKSGGITLCCYTDPDDDVVNEYFENDEEEPLAKKPELLRTPEKIKVYKNTGGDKMYRLYGSGYCDTGEPNNKKFLQARHPVCIVDPEKWQGRIGVMGDLHVSSRQSLFPLVNAQVIPGADEKDSPFIGKIAHENLSSFDHLLSKIGDSDVVALVGDLYDHTINCDPYHFKDSVKRTADLWDAMAYNEKYKGNYDAYPRCIDGLLVLSRILDFYTKQKKPVIYVSGNHEGYEDPFGISPRIASDTANETVMRTNSGICADHNLTFYEGSLLYGEESENKGMDPWQAAFFRGTAFNYRPKNFDWLYCLFSPWQDFVINYGSGASSYNFICLGWEKEEGFVGSAVFRSGGTLPRAQTACTQNQVDLTQWAAETKSDNNILLSHFTFVSYDRQLPLQGDAEKGIVDVQNHYGPFEMAHLGEYDIGSFYENRTAMYKFLLNKQIAYSICGHSHRPAVYTLRQANWWGTSSVVASIGDGKEMLVGALSGQAAPCLVCGSAGPFSHQNLAGELGGFGLDYPQGFILETQKETPPGATRWDKLRWVKDTRFKPRLAVVLDYLWYEGKCPPFDDYGIFSMKNIGFCFRSTAQFRKIFNGTHPFKEITLVGIWDDGGGKKTPIGVTMTPDQKETTFLDGVWPVFQLQVNGDELSQYQNRLKSGNPFAHFLSIKFREIPDIVRADDYDLTSPWCFPVNVGSAIKRPKGKNGGELPDWGDYGIKWPDEYKKPNQ